MTKYICSGFPFHHNYRVLLSDETILTISLMLSFLCSQTIALCKCNVHQKALSTLYLDCQSAINGYTLFKGKYSTTHKKFQMPITFRQWSTFNALQFTISIFNTHHNFTLPFVFLSVKIFEMLYNAISHCLIPFEVCFLTMLCSLTCIVPWLPLVVITKQVLLEL